MESGRYPKAPDKIMETVFSHLDSFCTGFNQIVYVKCTLKQNVGRFSVGQTVDYVYLNLETMEISVKELGRGIRPVYTGGVIMCLTDEINPRSYFGELEESIRRAYM